jgi:hypothetical protein
MASSICIAQSTGILLFDAKKMSEVRQSYQAGKKEFLPAVKKLQRDADKALDMDILSVVNKKQVPPSGDKHDYLSHGRYWWPDPKKPDGKPYIRRDGESNPEAEEIPDHNNLGALLKAVQALSLAYYFTGHEPYASHASKLIREWFINPETIMNPNLDYAQSIPGRTAARGAGIIDARYLPTILEAAKLISASKSWSEEDSKLLNGWFEQYLTWLLESKNGTLEANAKNNHGTWYDVQVASIALSLGKTDFARKIITEAKTKRIASQIEPDGRQPHELERTLSLHYCLFNLQAFFHLAAMADLFGIDLWSYKTEDGSGIKTALDWVLPFLNEEKKWTYEQLNDVKPDKYYPLVYLASVKYEGELYKTAINKFPIADRQKQRIGILY